MGGARGARGAGHRPRRRLRRYTVVMPTKWSNIIFIVLVFGMPALGAVLRKLQEQSAAKKTRDSQQRLRNDFLRTGRGVSAGTPPRPPRPPHPTRSPAIRSAPPTSRTPSRGPATASARDRLQEIAARRQAQLEELRKRRQGAIQQRASRTSPRQTVQTRVTPPARTSRVAIPTRPGQSRPVTRRQRKPAAAPLSPPPKATLSGRIDPERDLAFEVHDVGTVKDRHLKTMASELAGATPAGAKPRHEVHDLLPKRITRRDWQRLIVLHEVLSPPVALRRDTGHEPLF